MTATRLDKLAAAVRDGDRDRTKHLVGRALRDRVPALDILSRGLVPGIEATGQLFRDGEAFLPEILVSARAMKAGLSELRAELVRTGVETGLATRGIVVLGTVEGDLHDIGKNLVGMLLESNGFEVIDLGVDVHAHAFVDAVRAHHADIVALSALLTTTMPHFGKVVESLAEAGVRQRVRVLVGGAAVSREFADEVGADGFAPDCISGVDEAVRLLGGEAGHQ